jgi:hypothetical protein
MKKLLLGFTVLTLFFMLGTAALAGSSAPKSLCYKWDPYVTTALMTMKSLGKINTADGSVKYYSINGSTVFLGAFPSTPLTGTATFANGILRFNHTCIVRSAGNPGTTPVSYYHLLTEGTFNTATGTGAVTYTYMNMPDNPDAVTINNRNDITISGVSCEDYSINTSSADTTSTASDMIKIGLIPE